MAKTRDGIYDPSMRNVLRRIFLAAALTAATTAVTPAGAHAAPSPHSTISWTERSPDGGTSTTVVLHFPRGAPTSTALAALRTRDDQASIPAPAGGPQGASLRCNTLHRLPTPNATWTFQHRCGGSTGPWGISIAPKWCGVAIGAAAEQGMTWTRNGVNQGRQASHFKSCSYQFHGTYNPDRDYDWITFYDTFQIPVRVGGRPGVATLYVVGSFTSYGARRK
jgi:hypothetical protein